MSPVPIIARQRALSRVGEIRIGGEKPARGVGRKLETFRLTSQHKDILDSAASLYGGDVTEWESPDGKAFQLYTERSALPVLVIVGYSLRMQYEKWEGATRCVRRCDGEEEFLSGGPCVCNQQELEGKDVCDIVTRLMVVLHETGTSLGWQLRTTGENANRELAGAMMVAEELARGKAFVPATLRLTQRRSVIDGQTVRFVVPVLDFNLVATNGQRELEAPKEHTPIEGPRASGLTLDEGMAHVATLTTEPAVRSARAAELMGAPIVATPETAVTVPDPLEETAAPEVGVISADELFDPDPVEVPAPEPKPAAEPRPTTTERATPSEFVNDRQRRLLFANAREHGLDKDELKALLREMTGQESSQGIRRDQFEAVLSAVQARVK